MKKTNKYKAHTRYRLKDNTIVPGVTTITSILAKPALVPWANRIGLQGIEVAKYVDDKADIGALAHAKVIGELLGKRVDTSDYSQNQIDAADNVCLSFYKWQDEHHLVVQKAEEPLVSERYKFGGQYDIYGSIDKRQELLDLKTGSGIWPEHYYQLGGYLLLLEEHNCPVEQCRILNIPRSEGENFQEIILSKHLMKLSKEMFLDCLKIYQRKKEVMKLIKR